MATPTGRHGFSERYRELIGGDKVDDLLKRLRKYFVVLNPTLKSIQKSFHRWSLRNHPDKGGDTKLFQEVSSIVRDILDILQKEQPSEPVVPDTSADVSHNSACANAVVIRTTETVDEIMARIEKEVKEQIAKDASIARKMSKNMLRKQRQKANKAAAKAAAVVDAQQIELDAQMARELHRQWNGEQ